MYNRKNKMLDRVPNPGYTISLGLVLKQIALNLFINNFLQL